MIITIDQIRSLPSIAAVRSALAGRVISVNHRTHSLGYDSFIDWDTTITFWNGEKVDSFALSSGGEGVSTKPFNPEWIQTEIDALVTDPTVADLSAENRAAAEAAHLVIRNDLLASPGALADGQPAIPAAHIAHKANQILWSDEGWKLKGITVRVVRGRKIPKGTEGRAFWFGESSFNFQTVRRIGLILADGSKVYTSVVNVEAVLPAEVLARAAAVASGWLAERTVVGSTPHSTRWIGEAVADAATVGFDSEVVPYATDLDRAAKDLWKAQRDASAPAPDSIRADLGYRHSAVNLSRWKGKV